MISNEEKGNGANGTYGIATQRPLLEPQPFLPKPKVVKCGTKNRNHAPIKVKRTILKSEE